MTPGQETHAPLLLFTGDYPTTSIEGPSYSDPESPVWVPGFGPPVSV